MSIYHNLITKQFDFIDQQIVTEQILIGAIEKCFKNCCFSTIPYINYGINSRKAIEKYSCGDCVALSLYVQDYLINQFNIISHLIPATIPNMYKYPGYLDIAHVALAVPFTKNIVYVIDMAFYVLHPIKVMLNSNSMGINFTKSLYTFENSTNLTEYDSIENIISKSGKFGEDTIFNEYQTLPQNTYYSECYLHHNKYDTWKYFLCEIINPDKAITTFFVNIRKNNPFIHSTHLDKNCIPKNDLYCSFSNDTIKYSTDMGGYKYANYKKLNTNLLNKFKYIFNKHNINFDELLGLNLNNNSKLLTILD